MNLVHAFQLWKPMFGRHHNTIRKANIHLFMFEEIIFDQDFNVLLKTSVKTTGCLRGHFNVCLLPWLCALCAFLSNDCFTSFFSFFFSTCSQMDSILRSLTLTLGWSWLEWGFWLAVNHWRRHLPLLRSLAGSFNCHWPEIDGLTSHSPERSPYRLIKSFPCSVSIGCILHSA